jgi:hypothetical protein
MAGAEIFLFAAMSRLALKHTQLAIQWAPGALSLGAKQLVHEGDHSPPPGCQDLECVEHYLLSSYVPLWCSAYAQE